MMLSSQGENTKAFVKPRIREITMELLKIIRETENDDLTTGNLNLLIKILIMILSFL